MKNISRGRHWVKYMLILAMGILSINAMAQSPLADKQQIGLFKNSTTCVVLEDGSISYNVFIKDAVEKHWKITDYEFISKKEFEERRFKPKYSFLVLIQREDEDDPKGVKYDFMSLVLGSGAAEIVDMPEFCSLPLSYAGDDNAVYSYAVPSIVRFMQRHVRALDNRRALIKLLGLKYYNHSENFRDKALLLNEEKLAEEISTLYKVREVYPNYVEVLSTEKMEERLSLEPENTVFLHHVGPDNKSGAGKCFEMIFDVEGNLYYYNYRQITNAVEDGFTKKDLKKIR
ncbi:MAG: hypothetical protein WD052_08065 [Bacteroidales bacterium]